MNESLHRVTDEAEGTFGRELANLVIERHRLVEREEEGVDGLLGL